MAVDSRLKRQSATCMLVPVLLSGVFPDTNGVVQAEWQAIPWMYSGISAGGAAPIEMGSYYYYVLLQGDM